MFEKLKKKNNNQIINIAIDEDVNFFEIWIQTKLLKETNQCAYVTKISKSKLLKENKIEIISKPRIYSSDNEDLTDAPITNKELKQIYSIINKVNRNMLEKLKNGEDVEINKIPVEFCYTEEYLGII